MCILTFHLYNKPREQYDFSFMNGEPSFREVSGKGKLFNRDVQFRVHRNHYAINQRSEYIHILLFICMCAHVCVWVHAHLCVWGG